MQQTRTVSAKRPARTPVDRVAEALAERLSRLLDVIGPQRQLQPIPVRVRPDRSRGGR